jgi:hypothetical protein
MQGKNALTPHFSICSRVIPIKNVVGLKNQ